MGPLCGPAVWPGDGAPRSVPEVRSALAGPLTPVPGYRPTELACLGRDPRGWRPADPQAAAGRHPSGWCRTPGLFRGRTFLTRLQGWSSPSVSSERDANVVLFPARDTKSTEASTDGGEVLGDELVSDEEYRRLTSQKAQAIRATPVPTPPAPLRGV
jgi:hypothetical protein